MGCAGVVEWAAALRTRRLQIDQSSRGHTFDEAHTGMYVLAGSATYICLSLPSVQLCSIAPGTDSPGWHLVAVHAGRKAMRNHSDPYR